MIKLNKFNSINQINPQKKKWIDDQVYREFFNNGYERLGFRVVLMVEIDIVPPSNL